MLDIRRSYLATGLVLLVVQVRVAQGLPPPLATGATRVSQSTAGPATNGPDFLKSNGPSANAKGNSATYRILLFQLRGEASFAGLSYLARLGHHLVIDLSQSPAFRYLL